MSQTTLSDLPVEVHFDILKYAFYSAQEANYGDLHLLTDEGEDQSVPFGWDWIERDRRNIHQFPYNVDGVCQLWHDILIEIPGCWTRVIIDVANDPQRFLDIFLWSKDLPELEVTIFNSHTPDSQDVDPDYSALERTRVSAIADALRPHTYRCVSITFDVAFVTSLPSPVIFLLENAPRLNELILECKINNAGAPEDYARTCELGVREPIQTLSSFPDLGRLSMTGFWFMLVAGHPYTAEWFRKIRGETRSFRYTVSNFQFQKDGQYTLQNFVSYFSALRGDAIILRDLSLDSDGPIRNYEDRVFSSSAFNQESLTFKNLSADVVQSLFFLAEISPHFLTFDNCTLPDEDLTSWATTLILKNIRHPFPSDSEAREDTPYLASILKFWTGTSLYVDSCSSFDDQVWSILLGRWSYTFPTLYISNCNNFTVRGLRQYLQREHLEPLTLHVYGTDCPFPSEEDQEWFRTSDWAKPIYIDWRSRSPEDFTDIQVFYKEIE